MRYIAFMALLLILGCTEPTTTQTQPERTQEGLIVPNPDGSITVQKDKQGLVNEPNPHESQAEDEETRLRQKAKVWMDLARKEHPEWYKCESDQQCVGVGADCESSCRRDAINSQSNSDYVTIYSNYCEGNPRTIAKCPQTQKKCVNAMCEVNYI